MSHRLVLSPKAPMVLQGRGPYRVLTRRHRGCGALRDGRGGMLLLLLSQLVMVAGRLENDLQELVN